MEAFLPRTPDAAPLLAWRIPSSDCRVGQASSGTVGAPQAVVTPSPSLAELRDPRPRARRRIALPTSNRHACPWF